jgi:toxin-antitoxin system PIN domain toxin
MIVPDVNVLIYAHRADATDHAAYARWLQELVSGDAPFGCSEQALFGFVRIVTNPRVFRDPTPLELALSFVDELLARPRYVRLRPGSRHWSIFARLCRESGATANLIADAYHAALVIEHGCELATTDSDFARFPGLRWAHPLAA